MKTPVINRAAEIAVKVCVVLGVKESVDHGVQPPRLDCEVPLWFHKFTWRIGDGGGWGTLLIGEYGWRTYQGCGFDMERWQHWNFCSVDEAAGLEDEVIAEVVKWFGSTQGEQSDGPRQGQ